MKNFRFKLAALAFTATLMASSVSSCSVGDNGISYDDIRPKAIVTVKTLESGETYFQVDEKTTLLPVDWKNPYKGGKQRAVHQISQGQLDRFCPDQEGCPLHR